MPLPRIEKFRKMGLGLFLHWGLYSIEAEGEWSLEIHKKDPVAYRALANDFDAGSFDPRSIARLARESGFQYIVLTTRHHDGYSLYDTCGLSDFDAPHTAPGRDLVKEFVEACRMEGIVPFFYHTTLDWGWRDTSTEKLSDSDFAEYLEYLNQSVEILCRNYGEIGGFWFDGNWARPEADWGEERLYGIIRKYQPEAIIVNNTGLHARGEKGHAEIDCLTYEQGLPHALDQSGASKYLAGEMCQTFNQHWGYAQNDFSYISLKEIIENFSRCRMVGMNYLFNVGPLASGEIPALERELLIRFGQWFEQSGKYLCDAVPSTVGSKNEQVFLMERHEEVYGAVLGLGVKGDSAVTIDGKSANRIELQNLDRPVQAVEWVDNGESLDFELGPDGVCSIDLTLNRYGTNSVVRIFKIS
jgi:alpha-L-fucosidase